MKSKQCGQTCNQKCRGRSQSATRKERKCDPENCNKNKCKSTGQCRSSSLPPRPPTRRSIFDMPEDVEIPVRAAPRQSLSQIKFTKTEKTVKNQAIVDKPIIVKQEPQPIVPIKNIDDNRENKSIPISDEKHQIATIADEKPPTPAPRKEKPLLTSNRKEKRSRSIQDHEYLQFALRITEDIIRHDLYTNKKIKRVFNSHIEANRGRLDMEKMQEQVEKLCRELNIPMDDTDEDDAPSSSREDLKRTHQHLQSSLICICGPNKQYIALKTGEHHCQCHDTRCVPLQCQQHPPPANTAQLMDVTSLECVTEVTEPSSSLTTVTSGKASEECITGVQVSPKQNLLETKETENLPVFHQNEPKESPKRLEDIRMKPVENKFVSSSVPVEKPKPQTTISENQKINPNVVATDDEEYVLVTGPIFIPKSLLRHASAESEDMTSYQIPTTYSTLHKRADCVKHAVSYASNYPVDDRSRVVLSERNNLAIESQAFRAPPKFLQLGDGSRMVSPSKESGGISSSKESVLLNETDYDETPQRDFDQPSYKTTESSLVPSEAIPARPYNYYSNISRNPTHPDDNVNKEKPAKHDLLLGDDYQLSPSDGPYDSCLPYPINLFYPTVATQTVLTDFIAAEQLWTMKSLNIVKPNLDPLPTPKIAEEMKNDEMEPPERPLEQLNLVDSSLSKSSDERTRVSFEIQKMESHEKLEEPNLDGTSSSSAEVEEEKRSFDADEGIESPKTQEESNLIASSQKLAEKSGSEIHEIESPQEPPNLIGSPKRVKEEFKGFLTSKAPKSRRRYNQTSSPNLLKEENEIPLERKTTTDFRKKSIQTKSAEEKIVGFSENKDIRSPKKVSQPNPTVVTPPRGSFKIKDSTPIMLSVDSIETSNAADNSHKQSVIEDDEFESIGSFNTITYSSADEQDNDIAKETLLKSTEIKVSSSTNESNNDVVKDSSTDNTNSELKSNYSSFDALCLKLDKKYSSSPTNSQVVYVKQVVRDIDKYRKLDNGPHDRKQSLKQIATAIENTAVLPSMMDIDKAIISEPKIAVSLLHSPQSPPNTSTNQQDSEVKSTRWCGFRKTKKKKDTNSSPADSTDGNTGNTIRVKNKNNSEILDNALRKSIRFDDPATLRQHFFNSMGSVISDASTVTQVTRQSLTSSQLSPN